MKLRNKKTGKIIEYSLGLNEWSEDKQEWFLFGNYDSIDELKEEWEDYKPVEPLIKDEKVRNMVRLWAKKHNSSKLLYLKLGGGQDGHYLLDIDHKRSIDIDIETLETNNKYNIAELCGEEE